MNWLVFLLICTYLVISAPSTNLVKFWFSWWMRMFIWSVRLTNYCCYMILMISKVIQQPQSFHTGDFPTSLSESDGGLTFDELCELDVLHYDLDWCKIFHNPFCDIYNVSNIILFWGSHEIILSRSLKVYSTKTISHPPALEAHMYV